MAQQLLPRKRRCFDNLDRFIPNRHAMNFDYARYAFAEAAAKKSKVTHADPSPSPYRKRLAEVLDMNRTRILEFKDKPKPPALEHHLLSSFCQSKSTVKRPRKIPQSSERTLDAPGLRDDYYLNLLDWGSKNVLTVALETEVYLWDGFSLSTHHLMSGGNELGYVTSVKWAPDGHHITIGLENSDVQLWDVIAEKHIRTLRGGHQPGGVGSLDWNTHILTTGGTDGQIFNNDVRIRSHITATYTGHHYAVCGLKWSSSGKLASGGNDNLLHIWDRSMATQWLHRFEDHRAAVKALAWCPFQSNLLASGGGSADCCIKFWNTNTGRCHNSINTGSQVCSLLWNTNEHELLSSHGFRENQLTLWKYPSMVKITELMGHTSRILFMAQSPDGSTVATAAGAIDETIRFWNVFGTPEKTKAAPKTKPELFPNMNRIRLLRFDSETNNHKWWISWKKSWCRAQRKKGDGDNGRMVL